MIYACLALAVLLIFATSWAFDQRSKRQEAEDDLAIARDRGRLLHDQVPFPHGTELP